MNLPEEIQSQDLVLAVEAAEKAGKAILEIYKTDFEVSEKEPGQLLTRADTDADDIIHEVLKKSGYPILSEETEDDLHRLDAEYVWIVDPIDGTADFVNRTGEFSIMIALVRKHDPVLGVVYQPSEATWYVGARGKGAYRYTHTWERMHVSTTDSLEKYKAVVSRHHLKEHEKEFLEHLGIHSFMQKGSAGLKIAELAEGDAELYFATTNKMKQWDTASAYTLITEAGGEITTMKGDSLIYNTEKVQHEDGILVTNGKLHQAIVEAYRNK